MKENILIHIQTTNILGSSPGVHLHSSDPRGLNRKLKQPIGAGPLMTASYILNVNYYLCT